MSGDLPPSWRWATLAELLAEPLTNGRSVRTAKGGFPILRLTAIRDQRVDLAEWKAGAWSEQDAQPFLVRRGDFFIARGSGSRHLVGRGGLVREQPGAVAFPDKFIRARTSSDSIEPEYLALAWASPVVASQMHTLAKTTAGIHMVTQDDIRSCKLPVAPLREQRQIVDVVESHFSRLDAATATLERVQRNLERYRASVLKAAVEGRLVPTEAELAKKEGRSYEPAAVLLKRILAERRRRWEEAELAKLKAKGKPPTDDKWKAKYEEPAAPDVAGLPDLPEGWCWASLEAITSAVRVICYGILMPKEHLPGGVPYVKVRDMKTGRLDVPNLQRTSPAIAQQYERASLRGGDLLLAIRGTYGRVVDVPEELTGGNITQDSARLALLPGADRRYVKHAMLSPSTQKYFERVARGVAVKGVNIGQVRPTPIALPPVAEQHRIGEAVEGKISVIDVAEHQAEVNVARIARLRQSILKWAFEGRLVDGGRSDNARRSEAQAR